MKRAVSDIKSIKNLVVIDDLKRALLTSDNNFKQLLNSNQVPQLIYDINSLRFLFVNDISIRQYGYSRIEFLRMTILDIAPQEEVQKLTLFNEFMRSTEGYFSAINFLQKKNGENMLVETTYVNINYKNLQCILLTSRDITEKIKLEEKITLLKVARQQKITLAAINGQEKERDHIGKELNENINQLLTAARIYVGLSHQHGEVKLEFLRQAEEILVKAINETRSLSSSLIPSAFKELGLQSSIRHLFENYQVKQSFQINISDKEIENLDQEIQISLFRIIQEQLNNILKHAQASNIDIILNVSDRILLSITDDGIGFDTSFPRKGLGISNIINRVELFHGDVQILSEPAMGCSVIIRIPNENRNKPKASMNVLIVEDDPDDQEIIARAFSEVGPYHKLTFLNNGKMLVDLLQSFHKADLPSFIILDYNMPLLNGLETLKFLELDKRFNKIPKIIYSSSSQNNIKNLCYSANAKAFITKGISLEEIKKNIQEMLSFV